MLAKTSPTANTAASHTVTAQACKEMKVKLINCSQCGKNADTQKLRFMLIEDRVHHGMQATQNTTYLSFDACKPCAAYVQEKILTQFKPGYRKKYENQSK